MWWALIEEIAPRAEEMACEKEMACVRGYHVYKDIWAAAIGEVLVCSREPTNIGKTFVVKLYSRRITVLSVSAMNTALCIQKKKNCALPGNRTRVAGMGILHDTTTLAVLT